MPSVGEPVFRDLGHASPRSQARRSPPDPILPSSDDFTETAIFITEMNQRTSVKICGPFEVEALRILRTVPSLAVVVEPAEVDRGADAVLEFAGSALCVTVEVKSRANAATAWQLVRYANACPDTPMLLVAGETTAEAREILAQHGIGVIDGLGHAHIELPGLLFHVEGRQPRRQAWPTRLNGKAGVLAQALLVHPDRGWQVQELAREAGASPGLAHRVLARLADEGVVTAEGSGPNRVRQVTDPAALLDLWAEESTHRPMRTPAYLLARNPEQLITELGRNFERSGLDYALTGAAAASLVAPFVTAIPVAEVWVTAFATPEQVSEAGRAEVVADGQNVVFLQARDDTPLAFRERTDELWVASRFRLYADLRQSPRRGREQADHLRREVIGF